jgi:methylmalonyl-CoA mutase
MEASILDSTGFAEKTMADWHAMAQKALKGGDFDRALKGRTDDGLVIEPLYAGKRDANLLPRQNPDMCWTISQRMDNPDAEPCLVQAEADLTNGATGLSLVFDDSPVAYGTGFAPSSLDAMRTALTLCDRQKAVFRLETTSAGTVLALLHTAGAFQNVKIHCGLDPMSLSQPDGDAEATYRRTARQALTAQNTATAFNADGRPAHNCGATEAQELAIIAASMADNLRLLETVADPQSIIAATSLCLSVHQDQFISIAKIRAARLLVAKILETCGGVLQQPVHVMAETSWRMLTLKDPETNILRNTIAAFSAGIGGADEITVLPHTLSLGLPDAAARRLARNSQIILASECHLDHVIDPASGSGGLESLTEDLAATAWGIFRKIEQEGGLRLAVKSGFLQGLIRAANAQRPDRAIVGTTIFPAATERAFETLAPLRPSHTPYLAGLEPHRLDETIHSSQPTGSVAS